MGCRESFDRNDERGRVGAKVLKKIEEDREGRIHDDKEDGEDDKDHQLNGLATYRTRKLEHETFLCRLKFEFAPSPTRKLPDLASIETSALPRGYLPDPLASSQLHTLADWHLRYRTSLVRHPYLEVLSLSFPCSILRHGSLSPFFISVAISSSSWALFLTVPPTVLRHAGAAIEVVMPGLLVSMDGQT
ncbi:hypothetical protein M404DRAFT_17781 [Pisolithus tinctorius Marx 270]|uniref:Uncharacterized protein n=1 Tax=Pisolithus tinctorius Marx 270 TaxID=870435 RepID=A0A0C3KZN3_PISTI|nr:hypothetical protein M404DRAFT_17781 [Pisolithus tinctorius Marx 270]